MNDPTNFTQPLEEFASSPEELDDSRRYFAFSEELSAEELVAFLKNVQNMPQSAFPPPPKDAPKQMTGAHPSIRTTSTDADHIPPSLPFEDEIEEVLPRETESPSNRDISDDDFEVEEV